MTQQTAPYGSWKSPITADLIVQGTISLEQIRRDGPDVYWTESRPSEGGRSCIVRQTAEGPKDVIPQGFNARTRVHEYGGGAFTVHKGTVYFSNFADNHLYRTTGEGQPEPITKDSTMRYADLVVDAHRNCIICVREDHTNPAPADVVNTLVSVDLETGKNTVLVSGNDFYAFPRLSPDGTKLAFQTWNHPNMPWDSSELWIGDVAEGGTIANLYKVAGGEQESVFQPAWSPDGELYFVSDRTGWWNLYRLRGGQAEAVLPMEAEFGQPQWVFGQSLYSFCDENTLVCALNVRGRWHLGKVDLHSGNYEELDLPYTHIHDVYASQDGVVFLAGAPTTFPSVVSYSFEDSKARTLRASSDVQIDAGYLSVPQIVEFPTDNGRTAYGFYYPPANKDFTAPEGELPPLVVQSHGGPTSATTDTLKLSIQYYTSRGLAVLDVNYGGSTGYGRAYRERLRGQWGIVDVNDCCNGALYLVKEGLADANRLAIVGGSAGGYTTLASLAFKDVFKAGASYFGLGDLMLFVGDTHKFESQYLTSLIGPYPERADLYRERSPIQHIDGLSCPVIFFQGLDDKIVPPNQAEVMFEALRKKGIPVAYIPFEGEGHGFRNGKNIKRSREGEVYFYSKIFGFELADNVTPVDIENL